MRSCFSQFFAILLIGFSVSAAEYALTPESVRDNGRQSVALMRTLQSFWRSQEQNTYETDRDTNGIYQLDWFYVYYQMNSRQPLKYSNTVIRTPYGLDTAIVGAQQIGLAIDAGSQKHRFGAYMFSDAYGLGLISVHRMRDYTTEQWPNASFDEYNSTNWLYGSHVFGAYYRVPGKYLLRLGVQTNIDILTQQDAQGLEVFTCKPRDGSIQCLDAAYLPFLEAQWKNYAASTLWNTTGILQNFGISLGKYTLGTYDWEPLMLGNITDSRYLLFQTLSHAGRAPVSFGTERRQATLALGTYSADHFLAGLQAESSLLESQNRQDFDFYLRGGLSAQFLSNEFYPGAMGGFNFDNIFSFLDLNSMLAYNMGSDILQFGPDAGLIFYLNGEIAW